MPIIAIIRRVFAIRLQHQSAAFFRQEKRQWLKSNRIGSAKAVYSRAVRHERWRGRFFRDFLRCSQAGCHRHQRRLGVAGFRVLLRPFKEYLRE